MSLPDRHNFPYYGDTYDDKDPNIYLNDLVISLENEYSNIANSVNGIISSDLDTGINRYVPFVLGSTIEGVGVYDHQTSYVLKRGTFVDVWFDIRWLSHTGTGNLMVSLPYEGLIYDNYPFIGSVSSQNLVFTGYLSGNVIPGTRNLEIVDVRSGATYLNIAVSNFDTTLKGHISYVGEEERG